ncbi:MAG: YjbQ family protein, partial [Candidatus Dormibacteraeota bacterium]|nr:YjbQ family protein [Candidatus Dormibacteraeota bacterium]
MRTEELHIDTGGTLVTDITEAVERFARGGGDGLVNVFAPHATAGVALMETGSGSEGDLEEALLQLLPRDDRYTHRHGSRGHGADHLLPVLVSPSIVIPVHEGRMQL